MITLTNVRKELKQNVVLDDVSMQFEEGNMYLLRGHNGCGKTMLLRMICHLIDPSEGTVTDENPYSYGVIIENPTFLKHETVFYNLKFLASIKNKIHDSTIDNVLKFFDLYDKKNVKVKKLSLGMVQRLALCQAFMESPNVILLDEPFNAIDKVNAAKLLTLLKKRKEAGCIVIVAAHGLDPQTQDCFDHVIEMENGRIAG